jgi:hypothetical protein
MNQREKLQAQLLLLQELKEEFSKQFCHPYGEKYAELETEHDNGILAVSVCFDQKEFESDIDSQAESFFNEFINEIETKLQDAMQEEVDAYNNPLKPHFGNPLGDVDELMNSIKAQLVESIKK